MHPMDFEEFLIALDKISLYYWNSKNKAEIDFLLYNKDGIF